jgi:hypothetical protein
MPCLDEGIAIEFLRRLSLPDSDPESINLFEVANMYSKDRREFFLNTFEPFIKDKHKLAKKAFDANWFLEEKILIHGKRDGAVKWVGESLLPKRVKKDLFEKLTSDKFKKMLNPVSERVFLYDLAEHSLGTAVTVQESREIFRLAKEVVNKREEMMDSPRRKWEEGEQATDIELAYGYSVNNFRNFMAKAFKDAEKLRFVERFYPKNIGRGIIEPVFSIAKTMKATWDMSYLFRQGLKTFWSNPNIWFQNAIKSFKDVFDVMGGKNVMEQINAEIFSHPLYEDMVRDRLAIGTVEEEMVGSPFIERVPLIGKLQQMSDTAYTGLAYRSRVALYEYYTKLGRSLGHTETVGLGIGKVINAMTGRGTLGAMERAGDAINIALFSPRLLAGNVQFLLAHQFDSEVKRFMKGEAAKNLIKNIVGMAVTAGIASAFMPGSVEDDPASADFGKIRVGDTRFDYTGGMGGLAVLAYRLLVAKRFKSSTTGISKPISSFEFGTQSEMDYIYDFFENKMSPGFSMVKDILTGRTYEGDKTSLGSVAKGLFVPIIVEQALEKGDSVEQADALLALIAEGLGISVTTYSFASEKWNTKDTIEMRQFANRFGNEELEKANKMYNYLLNDWFSKVRGLTLYRNLDDETKKKLIDKQKSETKKRIFALYGFKKITTPKENVTDILNKLLNF